MDEFLTFWGKARPDATATHTWHPAAYHCLDVAAAAHSLIEQGVTRPPAAWDRPELAPAIVALIALHDVGKFTRSFQAQAEAHWPSSALGSFRPAPISPRHDAAGLALLRGSLSDVLDPLLPCWLHVDRAPVLRAISGHHGRPPVEVDYLSPDVACAGCLAAARAFAQAVIALIEPPGLPPLSRGAGPALEWWLAGFAVLADWIGSAEAWFPYREPKLSLAEYWRSVALPRAAEAVATAGLLPVRTRDDLSLRDLIGVEVPASPVQALAQSLELGPNGPALILVEDQTGSGKTEAALLLAHRLMRAGRADGLFVALPTMATANAMYTRLADAYRRLFQDDASPSLVLAHGRRQDHAGFRASILRAAAAAGDSVADPADEPASAQCAAWIADDRRRTFLASVGVGTIDQALLAVLPSRHAPLRLHGLHRRVLIIDEAHAYDAYMREELLRLVEFQAGLGGSAIVLSATLPQKTRRDLADAFAKGSALPKTDPTCTSYPLVTVLHRAGTAEIPSAPRDGLERRVEVERLTSVQEALVRTEEAARDGQAVAWIRNAVDDAIEGQAALSAGISSILFHARFAMGDRQEIEQDVLARFGKGSVDRRGVVVATQVIEQSLDLDFDLLVTDLAPMDLLVQRAGRVWRHARSERPANRPRLLVLAPDPVDDPQPDWLGAELRRTGYVYRHHGLLWRTARVLFEAGVIDTPGDVRRLVEAAYAEETVPEGLRRSSDAAEGQAQAHRSMAWQNLLDWRKGYNRNAGEWDSDVRTPTRLGEESVTIRLAKWADGNLKPWCEADTPARSWALSEVQVACRQATGVPAPSGDLARAEGAARATWGRWDQEISILPLAQNEGRWSGVLTRRDQHREVEYGSRAGLRFV